MIYDFNFHNPTKIYFGKTAMSNLPNELKNYGENVLLVYGKSSIKKNGIYDAVITALQETGKKVIELSGIKPNPSYDQVLEGARLVRENNVDLILAVGGGSVIDCSKAISVSAYSSEDPWQKYWIGRKPVDNRIVPVGTVLTMVGTASEMNGGSVITNEEAMRKKGRVFPSSVYPKFSILNPEYTYTVPKYQMVSGVFDVLSHLMEQYFSGEDDNVSDYLLEGAMQAIITSVRKALINPTDYEARSNIMWCATMALNYTLGCSKKQDWTVHGIEHQIGAYTDCAHGAGLAVVSVPYFKHVYAYGLDKFVRYATRVWGVNPANKDKQTVALEGIQRLADFIEEIGLPTTLRELGVTEEMIRPIAESIDESGSYKFCTAPDYLVILKACY